MKRFWKGKRSGMTSPPTSPDPRLDRIEYARQLLSETREEVARADAKASLLFSAFGVITSAVAAVLIADEWTPFSMSNRIEWIWWCGVVFAAGALILLGLAVIPRIKNDGHQDRLYFFGHVAKFKNSKTFEKAFEDASTHGWDRTLDQIWVESGIAKRKYLLTKWSMLAFGVAAVLFAMSAITDHVLS